jgi:hypothetical protein
MGRTRNQEDADGILDSLADYLRPSEHAKLAELLSAGAFAIPHQERDRILERALSEAKRGSVAEQQLGDALRIHRSDEPHPYAVFFDLGDEAVSLIGRHIKPDYIIEAMSEEQQWWPTWVAMDYEAKHPRDWLVHCTDHGHDICADGFTRGVEDLTKIALTTHLPESEKQRPGFNFAFRPSDFERYAYDRGRCKYGRTVVLFRAPYVVAYHHGDEERQAIFWGPSATDVIVLDVAERGNYSLELEPRDEDSDSLLLEASDIEEMIDLIEEHRTEVSRSQGCIQSLKRNLMSLPR